MSLELVTENKSNTGSGALNDLVFILYCRVSGQWLPTRRRSVSNHSAISWGAIGNRLAIGGRLVGDCILSVCFWLQKVCNLFGDRSATDRRQVGDQSATKNCVGIVCNRCNWSAISSQPVTERFHLQQPKPPCDQIVPATVCNRSATSRRPPCNHPATSLQPPEILVARRSPTGCKLCVTGALLMHEIHLYKNPILLVY